MSVMGAQSGIYSGPTFRTYSEKKPDESHSDNTRRGFLQLLKNAGQEQQESTETKTESESAVEEAKERMKSYQTALIKEILYGNSDEQYRAEKKKNKKYQLFRADNGAFGDKDLSELVNPSDNHKATWNSTESKKLTKDQIRYLKEIYDGAIPDEEYGGLLMELVDKKLLSEEEAGRLLLRDSSPEVARSGYEIVIAEAFERQKRLEEERQYNELIELLEQHLENDCSFYSS